MPAFTWVGKTRDGQAKKGVVVADDVEAAMATLRAQAITPSSVKPKGKTASADPPPPTAPLPARVIAAAAFGAMKDKRRGPDYVHDVLTTGSLDPDLVAAALALGFHKVDHGRRRPTYEQ